MSSLPPPLPPTLPSKKRRFPIWLSISAVFFGIVGFGVWRTVTLVQKIRAPKHAVEVVIPPYEDLLGEGLSGTGFHIEHGGRRYLVCSLHQFEGKQPAVMGALSFDEPIRITGRVYAQKDIQVLTYESPNLDKLAPLTCDPAPAIHNGDPVVLIYNEEQIVGHITTRTDGKQNLRFFRTTAPFDAMGCSGAPVLSGLTGKVIGVALTANRPERARTVGFELLALPDSMPSLPAQPSSETKSEVATEP